MKTIKLLFTCLLIAFSCSLISCDIPQKTPEIKGKQWVYVEMVTESKTDTSEYFLYGQMKKSILEKINSDSSTKGLFVLTNVRFTNDDQLLELYENDKVGSSLIFRIEDIEEVIFYQDDPIYVLDIDELSDATKKIRERNRRPKSAQKNTSN